MSRRAAFPAHCSRCGRVVLTGLDSDVCAFTATVDPWPADLVAETLAILAGRDTYNAHRELGGRIELERRNQDTVRNPIRGLVVLAHDCDRPHRSDEPCLLGDELSEPDLLTLDPDDGKVPF
jgi:hypothetical protein